MGWPAEQAMHGCIEGSAASRATAGARAWRQAEDALQRAEADAAAARHGPHTAHAHHGQLAVRHHGLRAWHFTLCKPSACPRLGLNSKGANCLTHKRWR